MARRTAEMTKRLLIAELLGEKFPGVRKNALFNRPAVLDAMELSAQDRTSWDAWLGGLGHESKKIGVTAERLTALAPILDVELEELMRRLGVESDAPPTDSKKKAPLDLLKSFMDREGQTSTQVAAKIRVGNEDALELASGIDDFLLGTGEMPEDLLGRIAAAYDLDAATLERKAEGKKQPAGRAEVSSSPDDMGMAVMGTLERTPEGCFIAIAGVDVRVQLTDEAALRICTQRLTPSALLDLVLPVQK
mgnify:CR=1 FL=1